MYPDLISSTFYQFSIKYPLSYDTMWIFR